MNKNKKYHHITKTERLEIALLKSKKYSIRDIARALGRSSGTISDEIKRNSVHTSYDPAKADHKAYVARKYSKYQGMKIENRPELRAYVEVKVTEDWSPEEVSGRIKEIDHPIPYVSTKAIYKYIASVMENFDTIGDISINKKAECSA